MIQTFTLTFVRKSGFSSFFRWSVEPATRDLHWYKILRVPGTLSIKIWESWVNIEESSSFINSYLMNYHHMFRNVIYTKYVLLARK